MIDWRKDVNELVLLELLELLELVELPPPWEPVPLPGPCCVRFVDGT
ncbi:Hypothetical protein A7982_00621 [Minicystis rosea]|nr:Hypothetical protein A7982_00621 [Minicystis rosea]